MARISREVRSKILSYISEVGIATRNDIIKTTGIDGKTLTNALNALCEEGILELINERPKTFKYQPRNVVKVDFNEIEDYYQLKFYVFKNLREMGWRLSPRKHEIAAIALMYTKFTRFRVLIFGSQGVGKTSLIRAVLGHTEPPLVLEDLHTKKLYDVFSSVKENTKVIEEQYRHGWGREMPSKFDKFQIVPLSKIGPSELLFRFIPIRVTQPISSAKGFFKQVHFEFLNVPNSKSLLPEQAVELLDKRLGEYCYFTIDPARIEEVVNKLKIDELVNYTDDTSAEFYRINARYDALIRDDVKLANWTELWDIQSLYDPLNTDLQLWNNALEVLKFNYAWSGDVENAVRQTVDFIVDAFSTFTLVKRKDV